MHRTTPHNPTPTDPILISVPEACRALSISESTFRRLAAEGLITAAL
jgi:predicted DNA-binding transcriptional regulator AlpA